MPLDKAAVTREGTDVSIITYGAMVREAIKAADSLAKDNISAEIIDLRTVAPLDVETIINSVEKLAVWLSFKKHKTSWRWRYGCFEISERAVLSLEAPIGRVCSRYNLPIRTSRKYLVTKCERYRSKS